MTINSIEERDNLIEMLKLALKFYANQENYKGTRNSNTCCYGGVAPSSIEMDEGSQARFVIEQVDKLLKINQNMQDEYDKMISDETNFIENDNDVPSFIDLLKSYENI